jgi:hypothetical protein
MKQILTGLIAVIILASCSKPATKVLVMASGKVSVEGNVVTLDPGTTHNEATFETSEKSITVKGAGNDQQIAIPSNGYFILNLKKDTLVGSYQKTGTESTQEVITQESLAIRIDSLHQLMQGTNVSAEKRNFNIPPNKLVKITENLQADIIGPYLRVPGSFEAGKEYEIYKFYTNKEVREIADKLSGMLSKEEGEVLE